MKKLVVVAVLAVAAVFPAGALAGTFTGVVVGKSGSHLAVASTSGLVRTVNTHTRASVGARVRVNGTTVRVLGRAHRARIHAIVVKQAGRTTLLAAGRSLLAVHASGRRLASVAGSSPTTGAVVNATVDIANGQMTQQTMQVVGRRAQVTVQAQVTAVGPGTITVLVNGKTFVIDVPGIQFPLSLVGQFVTVDLKLAQDENDEQDNDDQNEDRNDDRGHHDGGDDHGHHGGDDHGDGDH